MNTSVLHRDLANLADDELVQLAKERGKRDDRPFRLLVERHQHTVFRVCYNFINSREDAEDLTQEVFIKAYRSLDKFEGRSSFKTWVYRIAINTSQNELRRRSRRPQLSTTPLETVAEFMPATDDVESKAEENRDYQILVEAFKQLRPVESQILVMKDLDELPYADIAEQLGISLSAAKMRVQRARDALSAAYHAIMEAK